MNKQIFKEHIEYLTGETKQNKIAGKLHVSESKISKWFSGNLLPTLEDLLTITEKYNCSIDWLIGHEISNKHNMSARDVCEQIVRLDTALYLTIDTIKVVEPYTYLSIIPNEEYAAADWKDNEWEEIHEEQEIERPIIYFCNSAELIDKYMRPDGSSYAEYTASMRHSKIYEHSEINKFLVKYSKLKNAYIDGIIDNEAFDHMVEFYIGKLSARPITYGCNFDSTEDTNNEDSYDSTKDTNDEELPFD